MRMKPPIIIGILLLLAILGGALYVFGPWRHSLLITQAVRREVDFTIYEPDQKDMVMDRPTLKYDAKNRVLSFTAYAQGGQLIISEQAYPDVLIYDKLVASLNQKRIVQTSVGTSTITQPKDLGGDYVAVAKADNTLLFVRAQNDMPDSAWRRIFNELQTTR